MFQQKRVRRKDGNPSFCNQTLCHKLDVSDSDPDARLPTWSYAAYWVRILSWIKVISFFLSFRLSRFWCKENIRGFPKTFDPRFAKSQKFSIEIFLENFKLLVRETEVWKSIQIKLIGTMLILASILILMRKQKSWVLQRKCLPQLQRSESKRVVFQTKCRILTVSYQDLDGKYQGYDTETKFWSSRRNELNTSLWNLCTLMTQLEGRKKLLLEFYNLPSDWILCL